MKVVLFCGGAGMRLRGYVDDVPKPMVQIGTRPILWHLMKYYAHFGHKDFILCLGYKGNSIKDYFLHYDESVSNNFVWSQGGKHIHFLSRSPMLALAPVSTKVIVQSSRSRFSKWICFPPCDQTKLFETDSS